MCLPWYLFKDSIKETEFDTLKIEDNWHERDMVQFRISKGVGKGLNLGLVTQIDLTVQARIKETIVLPVCSCLFFCTGIFSPLKHSRIICEYVHVTKSDIFSFDNAYWKHPRRVMIINIVINLSNK